MRFVRFDVIDDQGNKERDTYVNPALVRYVTSMQAYGKNHRSRLTFSSDDNVLVGGTAEEAHRKLQGAGATDAAGKPVLRAVETP